MKKLAPKISTVGLDNTYYMPGTYDFRFIMGGLGSIVKSLDVEMLDPDRAPLSSSFRLWGKKVMCSFLIENTTPSGVCIFKIRASDNTGKSIEAIFSPWVIL